MSDYTGVFKQKDKQILVGGCVKIRIHFFQARITRINTVFSVCIH